MIDPEEPNAYCGKCGKIITGRRILQSQMCIKGVWNFIVANENSPSLQKIRSEHNGKCPWCDK